jgi:hypothetical protein
VNHFAIKSGDPAIVAGQALGEIASLAWEQIRRPGWRTAATNSHSVSLPATPAP